MELTALALGFMGSLHCVGMCSPLAMVATGGTVLRNRFLYHAGRIATYGIFGMVVSGFGALLSFSNVQNVISITLGIALLAAGIFGTSGIRVPVITPALTKLTIWLKLRFSDYLRRRNARAVVLMGMLNGILPCGLVYLALGYCLTLASWHDGFLFMILFGAGTLPALLVVPALLTAFTNRLHFTMRRAVTVLFILSGSVLIARGVMHHVHVPKATDLSAHPTDIPVCR